MFQTPLAPFLLLLVLVTIGVVVDSLSASGGGGVAAAEAAFFQENPIQPSGPTKQPNQTADAPLAAEERWNFSEELATACLRLVHSAIEGRSAKERANILSLVGSPVKQRGDLLQQIMHNYANRAYSEVEAYRKWEWQWQFCGPIFAERGSAAAYVNRKDEYGQLATKAHLGEEHLRYWEEIIALTPQRVTEALRRMGEEGGMESAYYLEIFHRREFTGMSPELVIPHSTYFKNFVSMVGVREGILEKASSSASGYVNELLSEMYTLLNHCYGVIKGEVFEEKHFTDSATSMARRFWLMDERVKKELSALFPKASQILLDRRLHRIYHRLFVESIDGLVTTSEMVCHMLKKFSLLVAFIDTAIDSDSTTTHKHQVEKHSNDNEGRRTMEKLREDL